MFIVEPPWPENVNAKIQCPHCHEIVAVTTNATKGPTVGQRKYGSSRHLVRNRIRTHLRSLSCNFMGGFREISILLDELTEQVRRKSL